MADFNVKIQISCKMALLLNFATGNINKSIHIIMLYDFFTLTDYKVVNFQCHFIMH